MSRFKELGASIPQVLLLMSALGGASYYYVKVLRDQEKVVKFASNRINAHQLSVEVSEALTNHKACTNTFRQNADIHADMAAIYNATNEPTYRIGQELSGGMLTRINLRDYKKGVGTQFTQAKLRLTIRFLERRQGDMGSFGVADKVYDIPVYLITKDDVAEVCMSDEAGIIAGSIVKACQRMGGQYNAVTGGCDKLVGDESIFLAHARTNTCNTGSSCPHPYSGKTCTGRDPFGQDHGNWVVTGFNLDGDFVCRCMPRECPDPASVCVGTTSGTDWCSTVCPDGKRDPVDWTPHPSTVCQNETFTQTNSCGRVQPALGQKDCT